MKVLITDNTHPALQQTLEAGGHQVVVNTEVTYESLLEEIKGYDAMVVRSKIEIDRHFLDHARHLKCIGRVGAGMETIDVAYAESLGIRCINSPEGNRDAVGEHALGLLLSLFNHIAYADKQVRQGIWHREENRGLEIKGKTIGIIGLGNMGRAFAQRLQGFECRIIAYDKYKPAGHAPNYVEEVTLEQLQKEADVVSLHVPLTEETRYMICADFIDNFAKPFYLINTSRGAVVKTADLADAIRCKTILGAALDVNEYEEMVKDSIDTSHTDLQYLLSCPNMVFSPHVGGWTVESKYKLAYYLGEKMNDCLC